jgi:hypothetical protein
VETAKRLIDAYRSETGLRDLFGRNQGTVAVTTLDAVQIFGSISTSPLYSSADLAGAKEMRHRLVEKYPSVMDAEELGRRPNNALFHAESNILLRAAKENGGSLEGRDLEVYVDRERERRALQKSIDALRLELAASNATCCCAG